MRPIVVKVGPTSNTANAVASTQTAPSAGQIVVAGSLATSTWQGTGSISGTTLTVTATSTGGIAAGDALSGLGVAAGTTILAPGLTAGAYVVSISQTVSSETLYSNTTASLVNAQRAGVVSSSNADNGALVAITGTTFGGLPNAETVTLGNAGTVNTATDFLTITQVSVNAATTGTVAVRTVALAGSPWVRFDEWSPGAAVAQCVVSGTVNYTIQTTLDDPNSTTNAIAPAAVTWGASSIATGATATLGPTALPNVPIFARVALNSGSGSVLATFSQLGAVPY